MFRYKNVTSACTVTSPSKTIEISLKVLNSLF